MPQTPLTAALAIDCSWLPALTSHIHGLHTISNAVGELITRELQS